MKTSNLTGAALNWAVGKAEGLADWLAPVNYCGQWEHGGPLIERNLITLFRHDEEWFAHSQLSAPEDFHGDTPLIAAMRCYVASQLGDTIDIPNELTGETA
jgi:hypothetical protein